MCGSGEWVCLGGVREVGAHLWREGLPAKAGPGRVFPTMILGSLIRSACAGITLGAVIFSAVVASTQRVTLTRRTSGEGGLKRSSRGRPLRADGSLTRRLLPSRAVESMLQAGHADVVLADTVDELPSLADVQLAHLRLRALCLPGENHL